LIDPFDNLGKVIRTTSINYCHGVGIVYVGTIYLTGDFESLAFGDSEFGEIVVIDALTVSLAELEIIGESIIPKDYEAIYI
jgi:hypothetical protein